MSTIKETRECDTPITLYNQRCRSGYKTRSSKSPFANITSKPPKPNVLDRNCRFTEESQKGNGAVARYATETKIFSIKKANEGNRSRAGSTSSCNSITAKKHSATRLNTYLNKRKDELTQKFSQERNSEKKVQRNTNKFTVIKFNASKTIDKDSTSKGRTTIKKSNIKNLQGMRNNWFDSIATSINNKSKKLVLPTSNESALENDQSKLFNLEHLKGKIQDLVKDVEQNGRCNPRNIYTAPQSCREANSARSTDATKSSVHSSAQKKGSKFRQFDVQDSYRSIQAAASRGISEDSIKKMKDNCDKNVKKWYLSKFKKDVQPVKIPISHYAPFQAYLSTKELTVCEEVKFKTEDRAIKRKEYTESLERVKAQPEDTKSEDTKLAEPKKPQKRHQSCQNLIFCKLERLAKQSEDCKLTSESSA